MKYASIYKNGKPERFFLHADTPEEFNFIQPYFLATSIDHPRHGSILEMDCLFSGSVWTGRQRHGYGYSPSADVYGELIHIIEEVHADRLTAEDRAELREINTHDDALALSPALLQHLREYNDAAIMEKYS